MAIKQSLDEYVEDFLLEKPAKETRRAYEKALKVFLGFTRATRVADIQEMDRGVLIRFRNDLKEKKKLSSAYVNRQLSGVFGFFKWLLAEGVIDKNPCDFVRRYNVSDESRTEGLSVDEIKTILGTTLDGTLTGLRDRAVLITLYYQGLRRSSLSRLDMRDLRTHRKVMVLRDTKTSDYKEVPLRREVVKAIENYHAVLGTEFGVFPGERDPIFVSLSRKNRGSRLSPDAVWNIVKKRAALAGINRRIVAHSFRHACATHALDHGAKIEEVAELLTHEDLRSTRRYDRKRTARGKAASSALPQVAG